jgi:hypothetical protein
VSKTVPLKDFGVPVPSPAPDPTVHLIVYYGPAGFTPSYTQAARIDAGMVSTLSQKTVGGVVYYDDPISGELPGGLGNGSYDFYFTLQDLQGNEGDFSPKITAVVDTVVPPTLGAPIVLT